MSRVTSHDGLYLDPFPTFKRFNAIKGKIEDRQLHEKDLEQLFYDTVLADLRAAGISQKSTVSEITATSKSTKIFVPWGWWSREATTRTAGVSTQQVKYGGGVIKIADALGAVVHGIKARLRARKERKKLAQRRSPGDESARARSVVYSKKIETYKATIKDAQLRRQVEDSSNSL